MKTVFPCIGIIKIDKNVVKPSDICNRNPYIGKTYIYWDRTLCGMFQYKEVLLVKKITLLRINCCEIFMMGIPIPVRCHLCRKWTRWLNTSYETFWQMMTKSLEATRLRVYLTVSLLILGNRIPWYRIFFLKQYNSFSYNTFNKIIIIYQNWCIIWI